MFSLLRIILKTVDVLNAWERINQSQTSRAGIHQIQFKKNLFKLISCSPAFSSLFLSLVSTSLAPVIKSKVLWYRFEKCVCHSGSFQTSVCIHSTCCFQPRWVGAFQAYFCCSCCVFATSLLPLPWHFHSAHVCVYVCVCVGFTRPPPQWTPVRWTAQQPGFWIWMCSI